MNDCWEELRRRVVDERARSCASLSDVQARIIGCFERMWKRRHCRRVVQGWLQVDHGQDGRKRLKLKDSATGKKNGWGHPAIALDALEHLENGALLTLSILLARNAEILDYSIGIEGTAKRSRRPWYARIDLTEGPEGADLCSHPLLHAHVGGGPDEDAQAKPTSDPKTHLFNPRVPLPWLAPWDALDWLMSSVDSGLKLNL
jgi:hypothetical protein